MTMVPTIKGVAPWEGQAVNFLGTLMILKASGADTGGAFGLIEQALPGGFASPFHVHHNEDEAFYLLEGSGLFLCQDQVFRAQAGSYIYFPRDLPHGFRIDGGAPARLLQWNFPAGLEQFFVEAGEMTLSRSLPDQQQPDYRRVMSLAPKYGMEILGPLPEFSVP